VARVCVDSAFFSIAADGTLTFNRESVGLQQMLVFETVGTTSFTKASFPGLTRVRVRVVGGGGGAAGANADTGETVARGGGGGGGYSESVIDASALGATETITVGAGGAGGINNSDGANGNQSSFGGFVMARGGPGSTAAMPSGTNLDGRPGTPGASVGIGQITATGGPGGGCSRYNATANLAGEGGTSGGGFGGGGQARAGDTQGADGTGYGGGGGGAASRGGNFSGGSGAKGCVLVELWY
jgi:hypothetical protein